MVHGVETTSETRKNVTYFYDPFHNRIRNDA